MNRNNCGCAAPQPNTTRTDYMQELYDTCDCVLPCNSCECVQQTGACPPPPPCKPLKMKCRVEKPKKGFWQLLFGTKKCSPCLKKKQDKKRKPGTKLKCVPLSDLNNELCKDNVESQQAVSTLNSNSCPRKGCFPTPKSICGCHFYFNIENRTRRPKMTVVTNNQQNCEKTVCENNETPLEYGYDINEEPERDNLAPSQKQSNNPKGGRTKNPAYDLLSSPYYERGSEGNKSTPEKYYSTHNKRHSANQNRKSSSVAFHPYNGQTRRSVSRSSYAPRKSSHCMRRRHSSVQLEENPSKNDVVIGLTVTKEETRYFMPSSKTCLSSNLDKKSSDECKNSQGNDTKDNTEQLFTVEIHKSGVKVSQNKDSEEDSNDASELDHNKPKRFPRSESLSRELLLLKQKKGAVDGERATIISIGKDETGENINNTQGDYSQNRQSSISQRCSKANLDRRVSEILKKLNEIENKINIIQKKEHDDKKIRVDFDGAKSTVSLHIKDPTTNKCDNGYNYKNSYKKGAGNTVIEIRHAQSKSSSPFKNYYRGNELCSSQLLETRDKKKSSSHKIVIKLPKNSTKAQCFVLPEKQCKTNENCKPSTSSCNVSDEPKCCPLQVETKCYCYECVQTRLRCL